MTVLGEWCSHRNEERERERERACERGECMRKDVTSAIEVNCNGRGGIKGCMLMSSTFTVNLGSRGRRQEGKRKGKWVTYFGLSNSRINLSLSLKHPSDVMLLRTSGSISSADGSTCVYTEREEEEEKKKKKMKAPEEGGTIKGEGEEEKSTAVR